jgi:hypothetical protein
MSGHQKKTGRDTFSYFIEFCGLEGFERGGARFMSS